MTTPETIDHGPNVFTHAQTLVSRLHEATHELGIPIVVAPKASDLGLRLEKMLAAQQEVPNYALIVEEMKALGIIEGIQINDRYRYVIGCTMALDPHTYLRADAHEVIRRFRQKHAVPPDTSGNTANGLPDHIQPIGESGSIQLPLHFVTWCFIEDTHTQDNAQKYKAVNALTFFAQPQQALPELADIDTQSIRNATRQAHERIVELTLRNKEVVAQVYNEVLLEPIVDAIMHLREAHPTSIHIPATVTDARQYVYDTLFCDAQFQRGYCNIGHSPKPEQQRFDSGRGPATLEPRHDFTRFVPMDRFALLIGKSRSADLTKEEYGAYEQMMTAIAHIFAKEKPVIPIQHKPLPLLAQEELSLFVKSVDTLSDYLATHSLQILTTVLRDIVPQTLGADIIRAEHLASATTIAAEHGKSIQIRIHDSLQADEDDATFGARKMGELFAPLQQFMHWYTSIYQEIFSLATQEVLSAEIIQPILEKHTAEYPTIRTEETMQLAQALAQLKPTAKAQKSWSEPIEHTAEQARSIQKLRLMLTLLTALVNQPNLQNKLSDHISAGTISDDRTLKTYVETERVFDTVDYQNDATWDDVWRDLKKSCFDSATFSLQDKIYARMATAVYGLERRGVRTGPRSENMPAIPGMLLSYRILKDTAHPQSRILECELGIASGQRASFEIVTGAILQRIADLVDTSSE